MIGSIVLTNPKWRTAFKMSNVIKFEVTPVLRQKDITAIERQGDTIAISFGNKVIRCTFYKSDFDKSMKALQKRCAIYIHLLSTYMII